VLHIANIRRHVLSSYFVFVYYKAIADYMFLYFHRVSSFVFFLYMIFIWLSIPVQLILEGLSANDMLCVESDVKLCSLTFLVNWFLVPSQKQCRILLFLLL